MPTREPITADEAFDGLPDEIRKAIETSGWQEKLRQISGGRKLRVDQGAALEDETLRFMAGLQTVEEYAVHLAQEIPLPEADFKAFIAELERDIFVPIQAKIRAALPQDEGNSTAAASVGQNEDDDLEALLNSGEEELAKVAAVAPQPANAVAAPVTTVTPALAAAAEKLALPVARPVDMIAANLQKPATPAAPAAPAAPAIPADPYRETF